jgi:xanthine dehydrogenase accessory factor
MRDVIDDIDRWQSEDESVAIATVVETWGSAPRGVGAKMALTAEGQISGSVSGGCVEGAVFEAGTEVLESGQPQLLHFGVADDTAWDVGLACGGTINVFVERLDPAIYRLQHRLLDEEESFATVTVIGGPDAMIGKKLVLQNDGQFFGGIDPEVDGFATAAGRASLLNGQSGSVEIEAPEANSKPLELFTEIQSPSPTLVMIGGVHIAVALTSIAKALGYRTVVVDPRRAFGSKDRFPHVDELIQAWPDKAFEQIKLTSSTAVASLTHDPKIDDPALTISLACPAFYIGALGSKKTHTKRRKRLLEAGMSEERFNRIMSPIGLDIGAKTPEEIATSIMAEIVAARHK